MKVICLNRRVGDVLPDPPSLTIIPDSALVINNNPLFVPNFAGRWTARFYVAFRICRLGKAMPRKFARRYYDGVTVALRAVPVGMPEPECDGLLGAFDNCVVPGQWLEIPADGHLEIGCAATVISASGELTMIDEALEIIGRYMTLRMGDIVMLGALPLEIPLEINQTYSATINGQAALAARTK
ncbi:MAG: hypothetical protein NC336_01070 [Clostridium sp.]|nr:hypothetical protein [Clostridium sp.]